jgi:hypothetical protein
MLSLMRLRWADFEAAMWASGGEAGALGDEEGLGYTPWAAAAQGVSASETGSHGLAELGERRGFGGSGRFNGAGEGTEVRRQLASLW